MAATILRGPAALIGGLTADETDEVVAESAHAQQREHAYTDSLSGTEPTVPETELTGPAGTTVPGCLDASGDQLPTVKGGQGEKVDDTEGEMDDCESKQEIYREPDTPVRRGSNGTVVKRRRHRKRSGQLVDAKEGRHDSVDEKRNGACENDETCDRSQEPPARQHAGGDCKASPGEEEIHGRPGGRHLGALQRGGGVVPARLGPVNETHRTADRQQTQRPASRTCHTGEETRTEAESELLDVDPDPPGNNKVPSLMSHHSDPDQQERDTDVDESAHMPTVLRWIRFAPGIGDERAPRRPQHPNASNAEALASVGGMSDYESLIQTARQRLGTSPPSVDRQLDGEEVQLSIRLPAGLRAAVAEVATDRRQSVTAFVTETLRDVVIAATDPFAGLAADMTAHARTALGDAVRSGDYAAAATAVDAAEQDG